MVPCIRLHDGTLNSGPDTDHILKETLLNDECTCQHDESKWRWQRVGPEKPPDTLCCDEQACADKGETHRHRSNRFGLSVPVGMVFIARLHRKLETDVH